MEKDHEWLYDSTWETDEEEECEGEKTGGRVSPGNSGATEGKTDKRGLARKVPQPRTHWETTSSQNFNHSRAWRNWRAAKDMQIYRHHYPGLESTEENHKMLNFRFYNNDIPYRPNGVKIEEILEKWKGDYRLLEGNHSYIQWLFPLREQGMNMYACELTLKEIEIFKGNAAIHKRLVEAYKLMLDFYGIKLVDMKTGEVRRAKNWEERFDNLNKHSHNNLRITRILKCLGEVGFEHYKAPLVKFFLTQTLVEGQLWTVQQSLLDYFLFSLRDKRQRRELIAYAWKHLGSPESFAWVPSKKLKKLEHLYEKQELNSDRKSVSDDEEEDDGIPAKRFLTCDRKTSTGTSLYTEQNAREDTENKDEDDNPGKQDAPDYNIPSEVKEQEALMGADQEQPSLDSVVRSESEERNKMEDEDKDSKSQNGTPLTSEATAEGNREHKDIDMSDQDDSQPLQTGHQTHNTEAGKVIRSQKNKEEGEDERTPLTDTETHKQCESKMQGDHVMQKLHSLTIGDQTEKSNKVEKNADSGKNELLTIHEMTPNKTIQGQSTGSLVESSDREDQEEVKITSALEGENKTKDDQYKTLQYASDINGVDSRAAVYPKQSREKGKEAENAYPEGTLQKNEAKEGESGEQLSDSKATAKQMDNLHCSADVTTSEPDHCVSKAEPSKDTHRQGDDGMGATRPVHGTNTSQQPSVGVGTVEAAGLGIKVDVSQQPDRPHKQTAGAADVGTSGPELNVGISKHTEGDHKPTAKAADVEASGTNHGVDVALQPEGVHSQRRRAERSGAHDGKAKGEEMEHTCTEETIVDQKQSKEAIEQVTSHKLRAAPLNTVDRTAECQKLETQD